LSASPVGSPITAPFDSPQAIEFYAITGASGLKIAASSGECGFKNLTAQLISLAEVSETNANNTVERLLACQHLILDLAAYARSSHGRVFDRLTDIEASLSTAQSSHGMVLDRLTDVEASLSALQEAFRYLHRVSTVATATTRRQKIRDSLSHNGLFVVGHARTGTSILQTALNTSPEILLLGEANLHLNHSKPCFAAWYRAMHESFNNPPSKSASCPDPDDSTGDAWDVLLALRQHYRLVGDKFALRPRRLGYDFSGAFRFLQDYFTGAYIIGTLRNPREVLASNAKMFRPDDLNEYALSYLECLILEIDMVCTIDRATILVHGKIVPDTFILIGEWLGCDLSDAYARCYEPHFSEPSHTVPDGLRIDLLDVANYYYERLRQEVESAPVGRLSLINLERIRHDLREEILREEERQRGCYVTGHL
jgi:Sulfotransferase family